MSTNEKCAEVTTQLQVDEFILDYLLFHSIQAQLLDSQTSSSLPDADTSREYHRSNIALQLVDCKLADSRLDEIVAPGLISSIAFLAIFHHAHADYQADADLQYRLRLLKFVVFFTRRKHTSSSTPGVPILEQLHLTRQDHARIFRLKDDGLENPNLPDLTEYLAPSAGSMRTRQEKISDKVTLGAASSPPVSLLDTLPSFMALSATHNAMQETSITDTWMRLAAGYMAQAVVEQYLVYESRSSEVLQEAFAWGFDSESTAEEGSDEWMINTMFFGEEEVIAGWDEVRDAHMRAVSHVHAYAQSLHSSH